MGADLIEVRPEVFGHHLAAADDAVWVQVRQSALEGPAESITEANVARPALLALFREVCKVSVGLGIDQRTSVIYR